MYEPAKLHAGTSMHHSVDHLITHGNTDQATTGWSTSVRTPAFLNQLIYGVGPTSADTERRYSPGCSYAMVMMMMLELGNDCQFSCTSNCDQCLRCCHHGTVTAKVHPVYLTSAAQGPGGRRPLDRTNQPEPIDPPKLPAGNYSITLTIAIYY